MNNLQFKKISIYRLWFVLLLPVVFMPLYRLLIYVHPIEDMTAFYILFNLVSVWHIWNALRRSPSFDRKQSLYVGVVSVGVMALASLSYLLVSYIIPNVAGEAQNIWPYLIASVIANTLAGLIILNLPPIKRILPLTVAKK